MTQFVAEMSRYLDSAALAAGSLQASGNGTQQQSSDGAIRGYKSVVFRPTSALSALPSTHTVKPPITQPTSAGLSSDSLTGDQTANGQHLRTVARCFNVILLLDLRLGFLISWPHLFVYQIIINVVHAGGIERFRLKREKTALRIVNCSKL